MSVGICESRKTSRAWFALALPLFMVSGVLFISSCGKTDGSGSGGMYTDIGVDLSQIKGLIVASEPGAQLPDYGPLDSKLYGYMSDGTAPEPGCSLRPEPRTRSERATCR